MGFEPRSYWLTFYICHFSVLPNLHTHMHTHMSTAHVHARTPASVGPLPCLSSSGSQGGERKCWAEEEMRGSLPCPGCPQAPTLTVTLISHRGWQEAAQAEKRRLRGSRAD